MSGSVGYYPRDIDHPNGFKTMRLFGPEDEKAFRLEVARFRAEQNEAARAALEGRDVVPAEPPASKGKDDYEL